MPKSVHESTSTLVLGATGSFGAAVTLDLLGRGRPVKLFARNLDKARSRFGNRANAEYTVGDASDNAAVSKLLADCRGVVLALSLDEQGQTERLRSLLRLIAAAPKSETSPGGPRIIIVPRLADFGGATDPGSELREAASAANARVFILRSGRYFGPTVRNWLIDGVCRAALEWRSIRVPGDLQARYPWTYAPDAARVATELLEHTGDPGAAGTLEPVTTIDVTSGECPTQETFLTQMGAMAIRLTGPISAADAAPLPETKPIVGVLPWWRVRLAGFSHADAKAVLANREVWTRNSVLDSASLKTVLPSMELTPLESACRTTLTSYRDGS